MFNRCENFSLIIQQHVWLCLSLSPALSSTYYQAWTPAVWLSCSLSRSLSSTHYQTWNPECLTLSLALSLYPIHKPETQHVRLCLSLSHSLSATQYQNWNPECLTLSLSLPLSLQPIPKPYTHLKTSRKRKLFRLHRHIDTDTSTDTDVDIDTPTWNVSPAFNPSGIVASNLTGPYSGTLIVSVTWSPGLPCSVCGRKLRWVAVSCSELQRVKIALPSQFNP